MNGGNFTAMHKPLERPRMNLQDCGGLLAIKQWFTVDPAIRDAYACWWFFLIGHGDSFATEPCFLIHKRGPLVPSESSNEILSGHHACEA